MPATMFRAAAVESLPYATFLVSSATLIPPPDQWSPLCLISLGLSGRNSLEKISLAVKLAGDPPRDRDCSFAMCPGGEYPMGLWQTACSATRRIQDFCVFAMSFPRVSLPG